jgi:hypothetical protein
MDDVKHGISISSSAWSSSNQLHFDFICVILMSHFFWSHIKMILAMH